MRDDLLRAQEQQRLQQQREQSQVAPIFTDQKQPARRRQLVEAGAQPCFVIQRLVIEQADDAVSWWQYRALLEEWLPTQGQCLGEQGLHALLFNLSARLQEEGWIAGRAELAPQNLAAGELRVTVLPGRTGSLAYGPAELLPGVLPLRTGAVLRLQDIDQTADMLNRLPSLQTQLLVQPTRCPEGHVMVDCNSDVVVQVQAGRPWRAAVTLDNQGPREYGRLQATLNVGVDAPSAVVGLPNVLDQLNFSIGVNGQWRTGQQQNLNASAQYAVPWGNHLYTLAWNRSSFARQVQGTSVDFVNSGLDNSTELRWVWGAWRQPGSKVAMWAAVSQRDARSYIEDVELVLQRRSTRSWELGLNFWLRQSGEQATVTWQGDASHTHSHARSVLLAFAGEAQPAMQQTRASAGANVALLAPNDDWAPWLPVLDARLSTQTVSHPISGADLPIIGTHYAVRGFDGTAVLQGRQAQVLRTDWRWPAHRSADGQSAWAPFVGLDVGRVRHTPERAYSRQTLAGMTLGVRWQAAQHSTELHLARPLGRPPPMGRAHWLAGISATVEI